MHPSLSLCRLLRAQERIRRRINPILRVMLNLGTKQTRRIQRRLLHFIVLAQLAQPIIHIQRFGNDAKRSRVGFEAAFLTLDDLPEGSVVVAGETFVLRNGRSWGCGGLCCLQSSIVRDVRRVRDKVGPYLTPLSIRSIERGSFALLRRFALCGRRYRFLPDDRFREISILPPTDPTVVA